MPLPRFMQTVGETYKGFVVKRIIPLNELQSVLFELVHEPSGAQVMQIATDDDENLFCLSFQTLPSSSNGAPHILEHTVLCGSRKFPIKDPFFAMTRRSLNTFMNALTGSDFTCYPAASQVEKDFYNLLDVYIDAVFHPQLKELSFLQEGHRLEFSDPKDPKTPLEYKGIVYNEMKGSLNSADARMWHILMEILVPDLPYAFNSGGDPKDIPKLSYQELINFHETYYHPGRCLYFFYGNLPLKTHLDFIEERALKNVPKLPALPPIPRQPRFHTPVMKKVHYPITEDEELENKTIVVFSWLTTPVIDQEEVLAMCLIDSVLMETDASLLKLALLDSGLCIQADAYMDTEMSEAPYAIVCKGCEEKNIDLLQEKLFTSLKEIVKNGISFHLVEAALHQLEFTRTEITGDAAPFGLTLFMRSALAKQHGSTPENALMIHTLFTELLGHIKDPKYLPRLIQKHLIDNQHFVRLIMVPDPNLASEELQEEKEELDKIKESLTKAQVGKILHQADGLLQYQKQTEKQPLDCLPKVDLDDVPIKTRDFPLKLEKVKNLHVFHHDCFTNNIVYADLIFDLPDIAEEELPYLHLLTTFLPEVGVGSRTYGETLEYTQAHLGGIGAFCSLHVEADEPHKSKPCLSIRGKALIRKGDKLMQFMKEISTSVRFDEKKRIEELMGQLNSSLQNKINRNAMRYAIQLATSGFSTFSYLNETWHGLKYLQTIRDLSKDLKSKTPKIIEKLQSLKEKLFCLKDPHLVLSSDEDDYQTLYQEDFFGLADLPSKNFTPWKGVYGVPAISSQARLISSPVAFTAYAMKTVSYLHPHAPALTIASLLFDNKILHAKVREQGGAYGVGAIYNPMLGHFYFHSYRDPHLAQTIKTFEEAIDEIARGNFDERDLEDAKLGIIQHFDAPISPGNRAITAYTWWREDKSLELRQHYRDKILSLTIKDIVRAIEKELLPKKEEATIVTFASKEFLEKENFLISKYRKPLPIYPV